jgi:hypothetical protein
VAGLPLTLLIACGVSTIVKAPRLVASLPRPLTIPTVMKVVTLADARAPMRHLPDAHAKRPMWKHVAGEFAKTAAGGDSLEASIALRLALMIEGVECHLR